jgi:hypothetical protein
MQSGERDGEEPGNQASPATMQSGERDGEEPGNQASPATMQSGERDGEEPGNQTQPGDDAGWIARGGGTPSRAAARRPGGC